MHLAKHGHLSDIAEPAGILPGSQLPLQKDTTLLSEQCHICWARVASRMPQGCWSGSRHCLDNRVPCLLEIFFDQRGQADEAGFGRMLTVCLAVGRSTLLLAITFPRCFCPGKGCMCFPQGDALCSM